MYRYFFKRIIDFLGALVFLIVFSWLFLIVAFLVRVKLGKGVIFKQRRVGKKQRVFWFYKFRTMTNARDVNGDLLPDTVRLTKFGKFLRKTSLDELPQIFNILKGDMSFIGPRPKDIKECVFFNDEQCGRFRVKPGISGLAQVSGRNAINFEQIAVLDNKYAKHITFIGDMILIVRTFLTVFKKKNIDAEKKDTNHLCYYYNDLLLDQGRISRDEYEKRVAFSKTLRAGDIMPSLDKQRHAEMSSALDSGVEFLLPEGKNVKEKKEKSTKVGKN